MRGCHVALFIVALCQGAALAASDPVEQLSGADRAEIKAVIRAQIEAFRRDDAVEAFSLASPGIQATFETPEKFLDMVRNDYQPVYRPVSVTFLELLVVEGVVVQSVQLSDSAGAVWLALYPMQRQKNGRWRTHGCQLSKIRSVST